MVHEIWEVNLVPQTQRLGRKVDFRLWNQGLANMFHQAHWREENCRKAMGLGLITGGCNIKSRRFWPIHAGATDSILRWCRLTFLMASKRYKDLPFTLRSLSLYLTFPLWSWFPPPCYHPPLQIKQVLKMRYTQLNTLTKNSIQLCLTISPWK